MKNNRVFFILLNKSKINFTENIGGSKYSRLGGQMRN